MPSRESSPRMWFAAGAVAAALVTVFFVAVGDGVSAAGYSGWRRPVVEHAHTLTWLLLALALGLAALRGGWGRASQALSVGAALGYACFLAAVML